MSSSLYRVPVGTSSCRRLFSTVSGKSRSHAVEAIRVNIMPKAEARAALVKELKTQNKDTKIGDVTVSSILGGMRGNKAMVCETSELDAEKGITYRGKVIAQLREELPGWGEDGKEPCSEGLFWYLLTGDVPTQDEVRLLREDLRNRLDSFPHRKALEQIYNSFPKEMHPMTQLTAGVASMQMGSHFAKQYKEGMARKDYWEATLEDSLNLLALLPDLASRIYRRSFNKGAFIEAPEGLDWAGSFATQLGFDSPEVQELMRLYLFLHADHEGGNVSAHACHLVGSALSDPYLSFSAGLAGLAGPLHGLANQESLKWILEVDEELKGAEPTKERLEDIARKTLDTGRVIPGFGHAVLRVTDPRYTCQQAFAEEYMPNDRLFKIVKAAYAAVPPVLQATGKVANPFPNIDAHSGIILHHYGMKEADFYTVLFGVARALGCCSQLVWSRLLGFPIERPKSLTLDQIAKLAKK